jgi:hypothetical protein
MTRSDTYGSADTDIGATRTPYQDQGDPAGTEAGSGSQAGTAGSYANQPGTTPGYGSQNGSGPGYGTEAGTVADSGSRDVTAMDPLGQAGTGSAATGFSTAEPTTGRHAASAAEAGLRPGEATDRLGDFSDIAFGNLLPDADQYTAQWQRIQFRFVDDPQGSVTAAADIVSEVTGKLEAAIQERQRAIDERQRAIQERARAARQVGRRLTGRHRDAARNAAHVPRVHGPAHRPDGLTGTANRHRLDRVAASGRRSRRARQLLAACRQGAPPWCARVRAAAGAPRSGRGGCAAPA